ncbi:MAG: trypsin-like serine protease, partial [Pseudonocardiaceae bacterium]
MLRTEIADRQFRRFVVRIGTPNGDATLGTGVLIAPGWVLTCAHVVAGLDAVRVVPDRGAALNGVAPQWV